MAIQGMLRDPGSAAWAVANHFINNEISNLFLFPVRFKIFDPRELVWPAFAFWQEWSGSLTFAQLLMVLGNLSLLAAGLAGAVQRNGAAGWTPLLVSLAYNFSTAIFRSSGGRFLLPVDWAVILIYALGWAQVFSWGWALLGRPEPDGWTQAPDAVLASGKKRMALVSLGGTAAAFLLVGMSLPLAEHLFPLRYQPETQAQMAQAFLRELPAARSGSQDSPAAAINDALQQPGAILLHGRALHPRYYSAGEEEPKTAKTGYAGLPYARLVFFLVGSKNGLVVLPLDQPEVDFPNLADVYILGCSEKNMVRAKAVLVMQEKRVLYGTVETNCVSE
ncbi:MAG: hypothetical protein EHM21_04225 [Chloroflexi bacterium]|nr:MAG: hypothetical protein EHM21_04225 [Chloroflexota bacterium]